MFYKYINSRFLVGLGRIMCQRTHIDDKTNMRASRDRLPNVVRILIIFAHTETFKTILSSDM